MKIDKLSRRMKTIISRNHENCVENRAFAHDEQMLHFPDLIKYHPSATEANKHTYTEKG